MLLLLFSSIATAEPHIFGLKLGENIHSPNGENVVKTTQSTFQKYKLGYILKAKAEHQGQRFSLVIEATQDGNVMKVDYSQYLPKRYDSATMIKKYIKDYGKPVKQYVENNKFGETTAYACWYSCDRKRRSAEITIKETNTTLLQYSLIDQNAYQRNFAETQKLNEEREKLEREERMKETEKLMQ